MRPLPLLALPVLLMLNACAASGMLPTRIVAVSPADGLDLRDLDRGERPEPIQPGQDYRQYSDALFGRSLELWYGMGLCVSTITAADAAAARVNEATGRE